MNPFQATVSALCYTLFRERAPATGDDLDFTNNRAVRFVLEQHARMPDLLRLPLACVTLAFGWSSLVRFGRPFYRLPHELRWRQVEWWRNAPVGVCRDLVRFYESFVIFHAYSERAARDGRRAQAPQAA